MFGGCRLYVVAAALVLVVVVASCGVVLGDGETGDVRIGGKRTLVVMQDAGIRQTHSLFLAGLEGNEQCSVAWLTTPPSLTTPPHVHRAWSCS